MSSRVQRVRPGTAGPGPSSARSRAAYAPTPPASTFAPTVTPSHSYAGSTSYPTFLSVQETALLHLGWARAGLRDAFRLDKAITTLLSDTEVQLNAAKSLLLNGLSLISIFTFDLLILPLLPVEEERSWFHRNLGALYNILWLWPVVGVSLWLNNLWCVTIARKTFAIQHGQAAIADASSYSGMLQSVATSAYRLIFLLSYVFLQLCLAYMPYLGPMIGFVFTCWINSYYCFEFVGMARGMNLAERLRHQEERWSYYLAFGVPSAVLCFWGNSLVNAALFALVFPIYIIMAMHANPVPRYPYAPVTPTGNVSTPPLPSPFIPIRLPIFAPVIAVNDIVVRALSAGRRNPSAAIGKRWAHPSMEIVEEGTELEPRRKLD